MIVKNSEDGDFSLVAELKALSAMDNVDVIHVHLFDLIKKIEEIDRLALHEYTNDEDLYLGDVLPDLFMAMGFTLTCEHENDPPADDLPDPVEEIDLQDPYYYYYFRELRVLVCISSLHDPNEFKAIIPPEIGYRFFSTVEDCVHHVTGNNTFFPKALNEDQYSQMRWEIGTLWLVTNYHLNLTMIDNEVDLVGQSDQWNTFFDQTINE